MRSTLVMLNVRLSLASILTATAVLLSGCTLTLGPVKDAPADATPTASSALPSSPSPSTSPTNDPSASPSLSPSPSDEDPEPSPSSKSTAATYRSMVANTDAAVEIVDTFWSTHWSKYFTGSYRSPTVVGLYDGQDEENAPRCGGDVLGAGNAFYCAENDSVEWDSGLMLDGFVTGDSWVYLVVAHEWGHAIQERVPSIEMEGTELQADCLAGAALFGAVDDGTMTLENGDTSEIAGGLSSLGDDVAWTDSASHGDAFERVTWFDKGRTNGVRDCFPED